MRSRKKTKYICWFLVILICSLLMQCVFSADEKTSKNYPTIKPNIAIQEHIDYIISVLYQHWDNKVTEQDVENEITGLKEKGEIDSIILQVLHYRTKIKEGDERKWDATTILLAQLYKEISQDNLKQILLPYLESEDYKLKKEVKKILDRISE